MPFAPPDREAGYWWELSMRQVEVSRTIVFDAPRRARVFFEALIARQPRHRPPGQRGDHLRPRRSAATPRGTFRTAIDRPGHRPGRQAAWYLNLFYKHSRVKQYLNYLQP